MKVNLIYIAAILILLTMLAFYLFIPLEPDDSISIHLRLDELNADIDTRDIRSDINSITVRLDHRKPGKVLVFELNDSTGNEALSWVREGFPTMLNTYFTQTRILEPITHYSLYDHSPAEIISIESAIILGETVGAEFIVQGDYYLAESIIVFDIIIFNVPSREMVRFIREKAESHQKVFKTIHKIANQCLDVLNIDYQERSKLATLWTDNEKAYQLYQNALWHFQQGLMKRAENMLMDALELDNDFIMCRYYLGILHRKQGTDSDQIFLAHNSKDKLSSFFQKLIGAEYLFQQGYYEKAIAMLSELYNYYGSDKHLYYMLADYHFHNNDYRKAQYFLTMSLEQDPELIMAYMFQRDIYMEKNQINEAVMYITELIKRRPLAPYPYYALAQIFESEGMLDFAIDQCRTALTMDNDFLEAKYLLGKILFFNQNFAESQRALINKKKPVYFHRPEILELLIMNSIMQGKYEISYRYFEQYSANSLKQCYPYKINMAYLAWRTNDIDKYLNILNNLDKSHILKNKRSLALFISLCSLHYGPDIKEILRPYYFINQISGIQENVSLIAEVLTYYNDQTQKNSIVPQADRDIRAYYLAEKARHYIAEKETGHALNIVNKFFKEYRPGDITFFNFIYFAQIVDIKQKISKLSSNGPSL